MDWAVSILWYLTLIVASPHYQQNLLLQAYTSGVPLISPQVFRVLESALYGVTAVVTVSYLGYSLYLWREVALLCASVRLGTFLAASLTICTFAWTTSSWASRSGLAVPFRPILRDRWAYNSNRVATGSAITRVVRFLFRPRAALVLIYAALILVYGGINYLQKFVHDETFRRLLLAFIATSSAMHYYYDGFIWKVREKATSQFLNIGAVGGALRRVLPAWKWGPVQAAYLAAIIVVLGSLETWSPE